MRQYLEKLYIPRSRVERLEENIPSQEVARVLIAEYACKGISIPGYIADDGKKAQYLAGLDQNDVGKLLLSDAIWHRELWPIELLRMTQIYPPESDIHDMYSLVVKGGKRFYPFAAEIKRFPEVIAADLGFAEQSLRDRLPIFGIRGKLHNHIIDGHHRTTLALWNGKSSMECLTAYKK